ncbi:protoheme IX farnesyltransferase [Roseiconus nitratireducens]|uniref:Protoheme IX farnesyltransferase n=1 Tax=Roseiconus nitratireducens TaxID=2605748 RepID=A0A5M6DD53_9BACT|nr:protoheme IX farnesyltransferase [Roseiconus nitratireducens]KAA5544396.1 protoheme IX farnesyltransferase [Roseiconus nitratireducens]
MSTDVLAAELPRIGSAGPRPARSRGEATQEVASANRTGETRLAESQLAIESGTLVVSADGTLAADRIGGAESLSASGGIRAAVNDLVQLTKPRIVVMILVTTVATAMIAAGGTVSPQTLLVLLLGTGLVAGSAGGANQIWERVIDRNMARTAGRPLPAGRMSTGLATAFTAWAGTTGTALLLMRFGAAPALVGLATWVIYVFVYTPMKTRTSWNTTVGAVAGALPMLIGYTALGGSLASGTAWLLFGVLAAWQYPHFMAIAWLYRRQYGQAGFCMSTTVEPTGLSAAAQSILGSLAVIGCGIALCFQSPGYIAASVGSLAVLASTLPMLKASLRFAAERNDQTARKLLRSSLLVLPAVLAVVTIRVFW